MKGALKSAATVLVAANRQSYIAALKESLEGAGYQVVSALDGLEAMESVYRDRPDVVMLDVALPRVSGYQVCRLLKLGEDTRHIPVVMLTSRDQPSDQYWSLQTGADSYFGWEEPPATLVEVVRSAAARSRATLHRRERSPASGPPDIVGSLSRLNEVLDRKLQEATILSEMSKLAWSATDLDRTTKGIMALFGRMFDFPLACLLVRSTESTSSDLLWMVRTPLSAAALTAAEEAVLRAFVDRAGAGIDPLAIRRRTVASPEVEESGKSAKERVPGSFRAFTLGTEERQVGIFVLWASEGILSSHESLQLIAMLASTASLVLDNARLYQEMRRMATTDGLTSLGNYRLLQESLEREFQRSLRTGEPLALLMVDLDNFKQVNDNFGHKTGDQVLQAVALAFMRNARQYDLVARYGGEEFAVVLPATTAEGAVEVAERFRLLVRSVAARMKIDWLSASVGVAAYPNRRISDTQGLVREADAALYRAKGGGKNRVDMAPQE